MGIDAGARGYIGPMTASSSGLHEPDLPRDVVDRHRAIVSIMEELEAVDWYDQRAAATTDPELAAVLAHNRDEEKEHAAMTLEWLRRHDPVLDRMLRTYLFTDLPVVEVEHAGEQAGGGAPPAGGPSAIAVGDLRGRADDGPVLEGRR